MILNQRTIFLIQYTAAAKGESMNGGMSGLVHELKMLDENKF
jgi:hypothetical protein